jgi:AraC family transcriptional regulator
MSDYHSHPLLISETVAIWDVVCPGTCRKEGGDESVSDTHLVFPYRGFFVRHVGNTVTVADPNQVLFFNADESYGISHPIEGGDSCLSIRIGPETLTELAPVELLREGDRAIFDRPRIRIDGQTQQVLTRLRYGLDRGWLETLDAETTTIAAIRRTLGSRTSRSVRSVRRQKLVDRAKIVLSSDLGRRWTLAEIAAEVGVSPVYLTQIFRQIEGLPLYRYHLQLRLSKALHLLGKDSDLTGVALDLGFSSYSHLSATFKRTYGRTPFEFRRSLAS